MNKELLNRLLLDQKFRKEATRLNHYLFFHLYFTDYVKYPTAEFHKTIFRLTGNEEARECFIMAFRGSAKSTIISTSLPIWAFLGKQQKKFIVIITQTQNQSRSMLNNIRRELEANPLLLKDFGSFSDGSGEWSSSVLDIPRYEVRILAASTGESIRGLRFGSYRPDLVILDDVEDIASVKTLEGRATIYNWFTSEVLPLGDLGTRLVVVGNLLHEDSLMMKLKEYDDKIGMYSVFVEYPLIDEDGNILWPQKYTKDTIDELKRSIINPNTFAREYLLKIVPDDQQIIRPEWIQYYDQSLPNKDIPPPRRILLAVDPAIKKGIGRDFTAIVPIYETGYDKTLQAYILPYIINKQLDFPETIAEIEKLYQKLQTIFKIPPRIYVESVGYQDAIVQHLFTMSKLPAESVSIGNLDKPTRLNIVSPYVRTGKVFFPRYGAETLIKQILNIYSTKHDDLADAFSIGISKVIEGDEPYYPITLTSEESSGSVYRDFGDGPIDLSEPITAGMMDSNQWR